MALHRLPRSSDLSQPRKELNRELVVGSTSDPLVERLGWSLRKIRSQLNWAPGSSFLNNSEFSLSWWHAQNALPLNDRAFRECLADMPDLEETALHAFYYCEWVRPFWYYVGECTARISSKQLVLLDVGYVEDDIDPPYQGEKCVVFLAILAVARMLI